MLHLGYQAYDFLIPSPLGKRPELRTGFLYGVTAADSKAWGYADWFLWPELGDPEPAKLQTLCGGVAGEYLSRHANPQGGSFPLASAEDIFSLCLKPLVTITFHEEVLCGTWAQVVQEWERAFKPYASWLLPAGKGRETFWHILTNALQCFLEKEEIQKFWRRRAWPTSHWLVRHLMDASGGGIDIKNRVAHHVYAVKVKLKPQEAELAQEVFAQWLQQEPQLKLRLDFNAQWTEEQVWSWVKSLQDVVKNAIEWIEDPCPWSLEAWQKLNAEVPLGVDWVLDPLSPEWAEAAKKRAFRFGVWKPSRQSPLIFAHWPAEIEVLVTTQLGHAWDWYWTAWSYERLKRVYPHFSVNPILGLSTWDS
jgi:hypothetical protein